MICQCVEGQYEIFSYEVQGHDVTGQKAAVKSNQAKTVHASLWLIIFIRAS